jgi:hypothetical protein
VQNLTSTSGSLYIEFYNTNGDRVTYTTVAIPGSAQRRLNLCAPVDLPQAVLDQLGTSFTGSMYIMPSSGLRIVAATDLSWPSDHRTSGYDAFPVP